MSNLVSVMLIQDTDKTTAISAMRAAIVPFGSLDLQMSDLACEVADARPAHSPDVTKLISLVFGYSGDNCANVEFHPSGVTFITPTSSTRISVYQFKTGWTIKVVFPQGSESRAFEIFRALPGRWDIRNQEGRALTLKDGAWQ